MDSGDGCTPAAAVGVRPGASEVPWSAGFKPASVVSSVMRAVLNMRAPPATTGTTLPWGTAAAVDVDAAVDVALVLLLCGGGTLKLACWVRMGEAATGTEEWPPLRNVVALHTEAKHGNSSGER